MAKYPNFGTMDMVASNNVPNPIPTTIAASGNWNSGAIIQVMNPVIGVTCQSSQTGNITIQKYANLAGTIATGTPVTTALSAGSIVSALDDDTQPFLSFSVNISNTGASTADVSNITILTASTGGL